MNQKGSQHLKREDRDVIEEMLSEGKKRKEISEVIGKAEKTITREISLRRNKVENRKYGLYGKKDDTPCPTLCRYPFVCNACPKRSYCFKQYKYLYKADIAQENYEIILRDSRIGLDITLEDKAVFDSILKEGIGKGQSIHHIVKTHKDELRYSERSAYRLIDRGQTTVQAIDLRRKVKLKPRKHYTYKEDNKKIRKGRTYLDYISFLAENPCVMPVQIDTVESKLSGKHKCFLTIHFTAHRFMLIFLLDRKTKENVSGVFENLKSRLGIETYKKLFPVVITDRGTEFCNPEAIEIDTNTGELLSRLFYCDAYSSFQKGAIEENHTLIRYIIPKSTLFDHLTQDDADIMMSHINSYERKVIDSTPYQIARCFFGKSTLDELHCSFIEPNEVNLTPSLFR